MNILVCLTVLTAAYFMLRNPQFVDNYFPYMLARYALGFILGGMLVFGIYLWTRKSRRDKRRAKIIIFLSLVIIAAALYIFV
jgi:peptidoglycan/LPS O-acetylase OafA/YrhL